jgi:signal transduction histidine kinase
MKSPTLKTKLQLSFLFIGLFSVGVTGWQSYENAKEALEKSTFAHLTAIRETKKRQIESYMQTVRNQAITLAEDRMIVDAMAVDVNRSSGLSVDRSAFRFGDALRSYINRFHFVDLLLVKPGTGMVVYSAADQGRVGRSISSGPLRKTNIARVYAQADSVQPGDVRFADFEPNPADDMRPAAFIATPLFSGDVRVGVLILQMSVRDINNVMTSNNNWRKEGLGETGETYIVGEDYTMRTDSRFFIEDPSRYFAHLAQLNPDTTTLHTIRKRQTSILLQQVRTEATTAAVAGLTDTKMILDYRNVGVLSSYSPLDIPGVHWVILSEVDATEAFRSIYALREKLILAALVVLLAAAALGIAISRTISGPIQQLAGVVEGFGKGDFAIRAGSMPADEIGALAAGFNRMAGNIAEQTAQLQSEIGVRSRAEEELRASRLHLRNLSAHLQQAREEERKGLAREIHDELGQALSTIKLNLALLKSEIAPHVGDVDGRIGSIVGIVDATIKSVRRLMTELRPHLLDDLGLIAAMEWQAEEFSRRTGIPCRVSLPGHDIHLDADRSIALFRIFQETLTNIARHASASEVRAELQAHDRIIEFKVQDNGRGITEAEVNNARSFGLLGMRERARYFGGGLEITGKPGEGTTVIVRLETEESRSLT